MDFTEFTEKVSSALWGCPVLILLLGGGLILSFRIGFSQLRIISIFKRTVRTVKGDADEKQGISCFQGFSTALAAAVGTGSVTGVGAALAVGGKGAVFWMWVSAAIGMGISYCENYLGVKYSGKTGICGAMSYLEKVGRGKILAVLYAAFTVLASLGMGNMAQASSVVTAAREGFGISKYAAALILVIFTAFTVSGKSSAAKLCERLVPFMAGIFLLGSLAVILSSPLKAAGALKEIVQCAMSPKAAAGGGIGFVCIEGIKRGAFSHEAGLGSSVSVHSSCKKSGSSPEEDLGIMGMAEVFIDTMVICTVTALVIIISGVKLTPDSAVTGYSAALPAGRPFISVSLILFALATVAGWYFIGEKAWSYLFGGGGTVYSAIFIMCVYFGSVYDPSLVWGISDIFNGLMALPNMTGVLVLSKEILPPRFLRLRDG